MGRDEEAWVVAVLSADGGAAKVLNAPDIAEITTDLVTSRGLRSMNRAAAVGQLRKAILVAGIKTAAEALVEKAGFPVSQATRCVRILRQLHQSIERRAATVQQFSIR